MEYLIIPLLLVIAGLLFYIFTMNRQLKRMSEILDRRVKEQTSQIVSVDMINHHINKLTNCINECLKAEETLRLNSIKEEKMFRELISNISHDLRTPLTAIRGYQQMLQKEPLTEEQQSKLATAMKHTDMLGQLIEHFYEYSYMINHAPDCNIEKINLTNEVAEYLVSAVAIFEDSNIEIDYEDSVQVQVLADRELLGRIIQNLIKNCVQHANGTVHIRIVTDMTNEQAAMAGVSFQNEVPDNQEIDVKQLFDRFYTADSVRKQSTGLGLAIVKRLTEQMNGQVGAELKEGMLEIKVLLPRAKLP